MKRFVLASLIALTASQAAGCIITSGDDSEDAYISASWELKNIATNQTTTCPPGYDTAALYNQPVDANGNNAGPVIVDLFNCESRAGTSAPLPPTRYLTWVEIADHNNTAVYAKSTSAFVDVTFQDASFATQILNDGGYFQLAWDLVGASSNNALTCGQAGVTGGVEAVATEIADPNNFASDIFDCEDHYGITAGYLAGTYSLTIDAFDAANNQLGRAQIASSRISAQNAVTPLGTIEIPITGL